MEESIPFIEVIDKASTVALASNNQVKHGKNHKTPSSIKWEVKPKRYTGFFDKHYPTAVICDEIPELRLHLVVIDLDTPKTDEDVSISILRSYAMSMIKETYSNITPSGGVHIYYLSKTKPAANQPRSTHNVNIDYQANIGNRRGKYVVADYRWDPKGEQKELYTKIDESPEEIKIVAKFFDPCSQWTWYATEYDPIDRLFFGLVRGFETELGYFSLDELEAVKGNLGLGIEWDLHFGDHPLAEALEKQI